MGIQKHIWLLAVVLWVGDAAGQSRLFDRVAVDFPNNINVAGKVLQPGSYEIRQLRNSASGARVLFITDKRGTGFEVEAATVPVLDNLIPTRTRVVVRRSGGLDYLRQVWIEGKNYGYEFDIPDQDQLSSAAGNVTLTATYTPEAPPAVAQSRPEPVREISPAPPAAAPSPAPSQQDQPQSSPSPATSQEAQVPPPAPPVQEDQPQRSAAVEPPRQAEAPQQQAQVQSAPPAPVPQQARPEPAPAPATPRSGNEDAQRTQRLPATATNGMAYFLGGILLLAAAVLLSLFRSRSV